MGFCKKVQLQKIPFCELSEKIDNGENIVYSSKKQLLLTRYVVYNIDNFVENNSHSPELLKNIIKQKKDATTHLKFHNKKVVSKLRRFIIGELYFCGCECCNKNLLVTDRCTSAIL